MGNQYEESLEIWKSTIGNVTHELKPNHRDYLDLRRVIANASDRKSMKIDLGLLDETVMNIYLRLVKRANPNIQGKDEEDLKNWIALNIQAITDDMMIAFRQTTKEAMDEAKVKLKEEMDFEKKKKE